MSLFFWIKVSWYHFINYLNYKDKKCLYENLLTIKYFQSKIGKLLIKEGKLIPILAKLVQIIWTTIFEKLKKKKKNNKEFIQSQNLLI